MTQKQISKTTQVSLLQLTKEEPKTKRNWSKEDIFAHLKNLFIKDNAIGQVLLQHAIDEGTLLQSLKDQTNHGEWLRYLKDLGLHKKKAQRLISLPKWKERLIGENLKLRSNSMSVTQAFKLVSQWNQLEMGNIKIFKPKKKRGEKTFIKSKADLNEIKLTFIVSRNELKEKIKNLEKDSEAFTAEIIEHLKQHIV